MRRTILLVLTLGIVAAVAASPASAAPPVILGVDQVDRHPVVRFWAPNTWLVGVEFASSPARSTDGQFLNENRFFPEGLTQEEADTGYWMSNLRRAPGVYWVMLEAHRLTTVCLTSGDLACASGLSEPVQLVIPKPQSVYTTGVANETYKLELSLTATAIGEERPYRVCYQTKTGRLVCKLGALHGWSWESDATSTVDVLTRNLPRVTRFIWYVDGQVVATRRVRVR